MCVYIYMYTWLWFNKPFTKRNGHAKWRVSSDESLRLLLGSLISWMILEENRHEKLRVTLPTSTACLSCHWLGESGSICLFFLTSHDIRLPPWLTILSMFGALWPGLKWHYIWYKCRPSDWGKRCGSRLLRSFYAMPSMWYRYGWIWVKFGLIFPTDWKSCFGINSL